MFLNCKIGIAVANVNITEVISVRYTNDTQQIGATCNVEVPLNTFIKNIGQELSASQLTRFIQGQPIVIQAWYDGYKPIEVFNGFVYNIEVGSPLKLMCYDQSYLLRLGTINKSWQDTTLKEVVNYILQNTGIQWLNRNIDFKLIDISFTNISPLGVLEYFRSELGLVVTLIGRELYIGTASINFKIHKLRSDVNVLSVNLQNETDVFKKYKVKAYFINDTGVKDSVEIGDSDGELREFYYYKVDQSKYKELANIALDKLKLGSYNGTVETLLYPDVDIFDKVIYEDVRYKDRSGTYVCTSVELELGNNGFKRKLTLAKL